MSLTVILADYFSGSISTSDALRRSGFKAIEDLVSAVRAESDLRASQRDAFADLRRPRQGSEASFRR